jgi:hypothetical protein
MYFNSNEGRPMSSKIQVEFIITGTTLSPDKIIGLTPTRTWEIGEFIPRTQLRRKQNGWCFSNLEIEERLELATPIQAILKKLLPKSDVLKEICQNYHLESEFACAIYILDDIPIINLPPEIINGLSTFNTSLDIDIILEK